MRSHQPSLFTTAGFVDEMINEQNMIDAVTKKPLSKRFVCFPTTGIPSAELILVFLKFMDDHPEQLHEDVTTTVYNSINKAYHCPAT